MDGLKLNRLEGLIWTQHLVHQDPLLLSYALNQPLVIPQPWLGTSAVSLKENMNKCVVQLFVDEGCSLLAHPILFMKYEVKLFSNKV